MNFFVGVLLMVEFLLLLMVTLFTVIAHPSFRMDKHAYLYVFAGVVTGLNALLISYESAKAFFPMAMLCVSLTAMSHLLFSIN